MNAKEFLEKVKRIRAEDKCYLAIKNELAARKMACKQIYAVADSIMSTRSVQYDREHVSGSKRSDLSDTLIKLDEAVERLAQNVIRRQLKQIKILAVGMSVINSVQDSWIRAVLIDLYIGGMTMEQVSENQHLSVSSVKRYSARGLNELDSRYKDFEKLAHHVSE